MKYKVENKKPTEGTFIRVPSSIDFKLKPTPFKVLVWLMQHKDGFTMNEYFIKNGIGMDYRTFRKNLTVLEQHGSVSILSTNTISTVTISYHTNKVVVSLPTNKSKKQEEDKPEETKPEEEQEEVPMSSVPLNKGTAVSVLDKEQYDGLTQDEIDALQLPF